MKIKQSIHKLVPNSLWRYLRERKIVATHSAVAKICEDLISEADKDGVYKEIVPLQDLGTDKVIWQYWAQGYNDLPPIVAECLASVDKYKGEYKVIRLSDANIEDYIAIPEYMNKNRHNMSVANYSDILRLMLLSAYGGVWMDSTILLTDFIPEQYLNSDFFVFQRDPEENNKEYWENTYAYYFGWADGFRVRMLNSFIVAKKHNPIVDELCRLMLRWWKQNDYLPDYFFFQILFDVLVSDKFKKCNCAIVNDCLPHYLQQLTNDPMFSIMSRDEILKIVTIHKLTYKNELR